MREIVRPGVNGELSSSTTPPTTPTALANALDTLDRRGVRESVQARFGVERMVDEYLALYRRIVPPSSA